jgi:chloramphenicol-sensitive protein RarD
LLSANWFVYIWAVNNGHVIDASLGYFITPLINVLLGFLCCTRLRRRSGWPSAWRLRRGLADLAGGQLPWIALLLASPSAATACCARRPRWRAGRPVAGNHDPVPLALIYVLWLAFHGQAPSSTRRRQPRAPAAGAGPIGDSPAAVRGRRAAPPDGRAGLAAIHRPHGQALLGVWVFHEAFTHDRLLGFLSSGRRWPCTAEGLWRRANARRRLKMPAFSVARGAAGLGVSVSCPLCISPEISMANYVYTMNRVGKIVPPKRQILKDISLSFFPGAKIGVLGLNGSGKSTLLKIMAGIDTDIRAKPCRCRA